MGENMLILFLVIIFCIPKIDESLISRDNLTLNAYFNLCVKTELLNKKGGNVGRIPLYELQINLSNTSVNLTLNFAYYFL